MKRLLPLLVLLVILAGCSGGSSSPQNSGKEPPTIDSLESKANLQNCEQADKVIALRSAQCDWRASGDVELVTFGDNASRDTYVRIGKGFGGIWVLGDLWAAGVKSGPSAASSLAAALGGKVS